MSNILTKSINKKLSRRTFLKASAAATTLAALGDKLLGGPVSTLVEGVAGAATEDVWIPTICYVCNRGPDDIKVHRVDGVAVGLEGNQDYVEASLSRGTICPKPIGTLQKAYNPYRVKAPLKRTNPEKGIGVDPGFVEISWDEALDTVAGWMRDAIDNNIAHPYPELDAEGKPLYGNLGWGRSSGGPDSTRNGTFADFVNALDDIGLHLDSSVMGGGGIHCTLAEHIFCDHIHGSGTGYNDIPNQNFIINSRNFLAQSGAPGIAGDGAFADARRRGMRTVFLSPYAPVSMAYVDEWVPIKVKTEVAFFMAMAYVMVHEIGLASLDVPFLKTLTNSPYLVGPGGYFLRHATSKKPLVWDTVAGSAKEYDDPTIGNFALEGTYTASGVERRAFNVEYPFTDVEAKPAYQMLKDHLLSFTPEWAEPITTIPALTIRRLVNEFITEARVGETIVIEGVTLPYRPAGINASKGYNTGFQSNHAIFALHLCQMLVGALEVPGTHGGAGNKTVTPGADGMKSITLDSWEWPPKEFAFRKSLIPLAFTKFGRASLQSLGPWMILNEGTGHNLPLPKRLGYFNYLGNPVLSVHEHEPQVEVIKKFPWGVGIAYTLNETNEHCDILLPDNTDLETSHLGSRGDRTECKQKWVGNLIRQRVVEPIFNSREMGDICTELADRIDKAKPTTVGFLVKYNTRINAGLRTGQKLPDLTVKYPWDDGTNTCILGRICLTRACTHGGLPTHYHTLAEYKAAGGYYWRVPEWRKFNVHLQMVSKKLRHPIPYAEFVKKAGEELQFYLDDKGITWWDTIDYGALPEWRDPAPLLYENGPDYDLHCLTTRVMQFAWGNNVEIPWILDITEQVKGVSGLAMNPAAAAARGISDGDEVWIESPLAKAKGKVLLIESIRPDCVCLAQQMGHWTTPVAKDRGWPTQNSHIPMHPRWVEKVTGGAPNVTMVKVTKV